MEEPKFKELDINDIPDPFPVIPFEDAIIVRKFNANTAGSLYLPESARKEMRHVFAYVVAVGPKREGIKVGDYVMIVVQGGQAVRHAGRVYHIMYGNDIIAKLDMESWDYKTELAEGEENVKQNNSLLPTRRMI